jgi:cell division protein FtsB
MRDKPLVNKDIQNKKLNNTMTRKKTPKKKKAIKTNRRQFFYSVLSVILIISVIQAVRGVCLNVTRYVALNSQIHKLYQLFNLASGRNQDLKKQIQSCTSPKGIEALARDNLKMVGKDEVLVVIKQPPQETNNNKKK